MKAVLHHVQGLRFAAAAMVLLGHLQHETLSVRGLVLDGWTPWRPVYLGGGVDIFFVISGFIMYTIAAPNFGQPGAAREFLIRRLLRVVPPYWFFTSAMVCATLLFSAQVHHSQLSLPHVLASYLFLPARNPYGDLYPVLILGWTLNFEMLFYVVFALGLLFTHRWGVAFIATAIAALGLLGIVAPPGDAPLSFWCNPIVFEFLLGMGLAWLRRQGVSWSVPVAGAAAVVGIVAMVLAMSSGIASEPYRLTRALWMGLPASLVCAAASFVRNDYRPGVFQRLTVLGGDASFALYLSHPFTLTVVAALWPFTGVGSPTAYIGAASVASIVVATGWYRWVERPVMARLNRLASSVIGRRDVTVTRRAAPQPGPL